MDNRNENTHYFVCDNDKVKKLAVRLAKKFGVPSSEMTDVGEIPDVTQGEQSAIVVPDRYKDTFTKALKDAKQFLSTNKGAEDPQELDRWVEKKPADAKEDQNGRQ